MLYTMPMFLIFMFNSLFLSPEDVLRPIPSRFQLPGPWLTNVRTDLKYGFQASRVILKVDPDCEQPRWFELSHITGLRLYLQIVHHSSISNNIHTIFFIKMSPENDIYRCNNNKRFMQGFSLKFFLFFYNHIV